MENEALGITVCLDLLFDIHLKDGNSFSADSFLL